ncbi:hypothetical protein MASR1M45_30420 [Candidatus Kapaibacterium sp.]
MNTGIWSKLIFIVNKEIRAEKIPKYNEDLKTKSMLPSLYNKANNDNPTPKMCRMLTS